VEPESPVSDKAVADDVAIDDTMAEEAADEAEDASVEELAADLDARHAGWQYKIPGYKANLIARRWDDILKAQEE
jgi:hypothetical protein